MAGPGPRTTPRHTAGVAAPMAQLHSCALPRGSSDGSGRLLVGTEQCSILHALGHSPRFAGGVPRPIVSPEQRRRFCAEIKVSIYIIFPITDKAVVLPVSHVAPESRSTLRTCAGAGVLLSPGAALQERMGRSRALPPPASCPIAPQECCPSHCLILTLPPGGLSTRQGPVCEDPGAR